MSLDTKGERKQERRTFTSKKEVRPYVMNFLFMY